MTARMEDARIDGMDESPDSGRAVVFTLVHSADDESGVRLLVESLRAFGGALADSTVLVFQSDPGAELRVYGDLDNVYGIPLTVPPVWRGYHFAAKVYAASEAEKMAWDDAGTLIWMNPGCLVTGPPVLLDVERSLDAAFRVVHVRNVGSPAGSPVDGFWERVYHGAGVAAPEVSLESFVDRDAIRPYFNSHMFSVNPSRGLLRRWLEHWKSAVSDEEFMSGPCADEEHRIFLHQAILSALLTEPLAKGRLRELPPEYSYPLHFHDRVREDRRPTTLGELVCPVYEGVFRYPESLNGLAVADPLASWLVKHTLDAGSA